jgi:hydroxymethylpyrimidine pyrophosphatase-like HAD family hydrolase
VSLDKHNEALRDFLAQSQFMSHGAIVTDLDGTAVHEFAGSIAIPKQVSRALTALNDRGRSVILNSLRFPLNIIQTFGREWYSVTNAPLPVVSLNGGVVGYLTVDSKNEIVFEEIDAFPLTEDDVNEVIVGLDGLNRAGIDDVVLFYYPRNWKLGEIIWTPSPQKVAALEAKYHSASKVISTPVPVLKKTLIEHQPCMMALLIEAPEDQLMAYQHAKRSSFITRRGVDKLSSLNHLANLLQIDLAHSIGAGDTPMDVFLKGVGLAVRVGALQLEYKGLLQTIDVQNSIELGDLLYRLIELHDQEFADGNQD